MDAESNRETTVQATGAQRAGTTRSGHPPRARIAYRVGVVGHRPNRLSSSDQDRKALQARIAMVLAAVRASVEDFRLTAPEAKLYSPDPTRLTAVTSLAEGADRIFAEAALDEGYRLWCPLPFAQEAFEADFAPGATLEPERDSVADFRALLARTDASGRPATVYELDGDPATEETKAAAYANAGRLVLNQSDLLIVVWDGGKASGVGGTAQTLREALRYHVPILWIEARAPFAWKMVRSEEDLLCLERGDVCAPEAPLSGDPDQEAAAVRDAIDPIVRGELGLPADTPPPHHHKHAHGHEEAREESKHASAYFHEPRRRLNLCVLWGVFRELVANFRLRIPSLRVKNFSEASAPGWPGPASVAAPERGSDPEAVLAWIDEQLRPHFAWSDGLAGLCANAYRSAFVASYFLSALAVFVTLLPSVSASGRPGSAMVVETWCAVLEGVMVCVVLALLVFGRRRRWHDRWMEYRVLAELIRELRFLIPLGGGRPLARIPIHLAVYGDPGQTWMFWHMRAIARSIGVPAARVSHAYLGACVDQMTHTIEDPGSGQKAFHDRNSELCERIHHRLHRLSEFFFFMTILGVFAHYVLLQGSMEGITAFLGPLGLDPEHAGRLLIVVSAFFPALGAALAGINNQGEFRRIAKRSRSMSAGLDLIARQCDALAEKLGGAERVGSAEVVRLAGDLAGTMVEEVVEWRVVVLDRPQTA